jgi:hypothetical protein
METDYHKLNWFDASAVVVATIGVGLIGLIVLLALPQNLQKNLASAVQILDVRDGANEEVQVILAIFETGDEVNQVSYRVFSKLALDYRKSLSLPKQVQIAIERFGEFSESVSSGTQQQAALVQVNAERGEVLGAFIDSSLEALKQTTVETPRQNLTEINLGTGGRNYTYEPPDKKSARQYFTNLFINN